MKALTLTQPWASAVAAGIKTIETRSWSTKHRGVIAIHAALNMPAAAHTFADHLFRTGKLQKYPLPCGAVVATAELFHCRSTRDFIPIDVEEDPVERRGPHLDGGRGDGIPWSCSALEQELGNFAPDRFAWFLRDIRPLERPIPVRGALGLWEWTTTALVGRA